MFKLVIRHGYCHYRDSKDPMRRTRALLDHSFGFLIVGFVWVAVHRTQLHRKRKTKRKFPLIVILSWCSALVCVVFLVFSCTIANAQNGGTLVFLAMMSCVLNVKSTLMLIALVELGTRMLPRGVKVDSAALRVSEVNPALKVIISINLFLSFVVMIVLGVMVFAIPSLNAIWLSVAFAIEALMLILLGAAIIYQLQRCIAVVHASFVDSNHILTTDQSHKLAEVVKKMRRQQVILTCLAIPFSVFFILLAAFVIPRNWGCVLLILAGDALTSISVVRSLISKPQKSLQVKVG